MTIGRLYIYVGWTKRAGLFCIGWEPKARSLSYNPQGFEESLPPARYIHLFVKPGYWQLGPVWEYGGYYWSFGLGPFFLYCWG